MHYPVYDITNEHGIPLRVRIVREGQGYGLEDKVLHTGPEVLVEFFDKRYEHTPNGQFISRYRADTLLDNKTNVYRGIRLEGGVPEWEIGPTHLWVIQAFIIGVLEATK